MILNDDQFNEVLNQKESGGFVNFNNTPTITGSFVGPVYKFAQYWDAQQNKSVKCSKDGAARLGFDARDMYARHFLNTDGQLQIVEQGKMFWGILRDQSAVKFQKNRYVLSITKTPNPADVRKPTWSIDILSEDNGEGTLTAMLEGDLLGQHADMINDVALGEALENLYGPQIAAFNQSAGVSQLVGDVLGGNLISTNNL